MASETGQLLAEIKSRTGLSWQQLADTIGASSGDYVRKVASGAKPGRNLDAAVGELMAKGTVTTAPQRRRAASGALAKVRAPRSSGVRSVVPEVRPIRPAAPRGVFRMPGGRLGWSQSIDARDGDAIKAAVRSAGRGRHRVSFRVKYRDAKGRVQHATIGQRGGYAPRDALGRMGGDPITWLNTQIGDRYGASAATGFGGFNIEDAPDTGQMILDVEVIAE